MSALRPDIKRGRLSPDESLSIERLAARKLNAGQIAIRINRHRATVNFAMHRLGLTALSTRQPPVSFTRKNGSVVHSFTPDEDAMLLEMRTAGSTWLEIAAACMDLFGRKRSASTVGIRLKMLANAEDRQ